MEEEEGGREGEEEADEMKESFVPLEEGAGEEVGERADRGELVMYWEVVEGGGAVLTRSEEGWWEEPGGGWSEDTGMGKEEEGRGKGTCGGVGMGEGEGRAERAGDVGPPGGLDG